MSVYVGIDVHRKRSQVAVIDRSGEVLANRNVPNGLEPILGLRSDWSGHCLQIVKRVFTALRLRKTQDKCHVKVSGTEEP